MTFYPDLKCVYTPPVRTKIQIHFTQRGWLAMKKSLISLFRLLPIILISAPILSLRAQTIVRTDPALDKIVPADAKVEKVHGDFRFIEGPVWDKTGGFLLFSNIPANSIMKWTPDGTVSVFKQPIFAGTYPDGVLIGSNGLTLDRQGRLVAAEHGNRRVARYDKSGAVTVLADRYEGKRLNSPNDLVVKKNGDVYFTDPQGLERNYPADAKDAPKTELDFNGVYRISTDGKLTLLTKDIPYPNGIAFSPDEKKLYVANSRPDKFWMVFDVNSDGTLANGRKFFDATQIPGDDVPDGMKIDTAGNLYSTGPAGIMIFSPDAKLLGTIQFPELPSNCAWGDPYSKTLYVTARTGLYRIHLKITGIRP
jgi:gluconolactonase